MRSGFYQNTLSGIPAFKKRFGLMFLLWGILLCGLDARGQVPQHFSFQGVARDENGKILSNATISLRTTIRKDTPQGESVCQQYHDDIPTNSNGIFNTVIGRTTGGNCIESIQWNLHSHFLQIELDKTGEIDGTSYIDAGTTQLLSVPYALLSNETVRWKDSDPVIQSGTTGSGAIIDNPGSGAKLIWYPRKAAFRTGTYIGADLSDDKMGLSSFAAGNRNIALGDNSTALGFNSKANADGSIAIGRDLIVNTINGIALGQGNSTIDTPQEPANVRLFEIGYGTNANGKNALTVSNTGLTGIGSNSINPQYLLDIGGRARIKHKGETAGIHFNNSANIESGFVGMKDDTNIGFFLNNSWMLWINSEGDGRIQGQLFSNSDRRLKRDFSPLSNSLSKLTNIAGQHYFWKDSTKSQALQTGLIAQEVEQYFPELVTADEKGFKAVNYIGLIPHLIESVKALKAQTETIGALEKKLESFASRENQMRNEVETIIRDLRSEMNNMKASNNSNTQSK